MSRIINTVRETQNFDFLYGSFNLSRWTIPYFASTLSFAEAADDLKITSDMPPNANITWSLTELYQRDIDWMRVERQILPYLRSTDNPQFFNSITIALLPYRNDDGRILDKFSDSSDWSPPDLKAPENFAKAWQLGPISFGFWSDWETSSDQGFLSGRMAWNKDQIFGVAIDGQHRLAAIKKLAESGTNTRLSTSRVPVIFLLFDESVGYQDPVHTPTVEVLRALFIDLNKNAQTVKRGRQILLDDRDPHATCARALLSERLSQTADSISNYPPTLPLSLVDWHSEQAKFDSGPYLATVLGLDWIVIRCLDTKPISDWTDYPAIERQVKKLNIRLGISLDDALNRLEDLASLKMSTFSYSDADLKEIAAGFLQVWQRPLVRLLTELSPYSDLIKIRNVNGSFDIEFQEWFRLYEAKLREGSLAGESSRAYDKFIDAMRLKAVNPRGESEFTTRLQVIESSKKQNLAFNVVFQKSVVEAFLTYLRFTDEHISAISPEQEDDLDIDFGELSLGEPASETGGTPGLDVESGAEQTFDDNSVDEHVYERRSSEFIEALNAMISGNSYFLDIDCSLSADSEADSFLFWVGSLLKSEGGIDFTQSAASRAKDLILLLVMSWVHSACTGEVDDSDFDTFWSSCRSSSPTTRFFKVGKQAVDRLSAEDSSVGSRILRSSSQNFSFDAAEKLIRDRIFAIWETS